LARGGGSGFIARKAIRNPANQLPGFTHIFLRSLEIANRETKNKSAV
jgi:hypothetical protein